MADTASSLAAWIEALLAQGAGDLCRRYGNGAAWPEVARLKVQWVAAQGGGSLYVPASQVDADLLHRLHGHLRGAACEDELWEVILSELAHPLPDEVAHDLIDRRLAIDALGHSRQSDPVQRRMASFYPEALLTLGVELFTDPTRPASELRALLHGVSESHPGWNWLLETLARRAPSNAEKDQLLLDATSRHPDPASLIRLREVRLLTTRAADPMLPPEEARELHATGEPRVWLALASNRATPADVLEQLTETAGHTLARQIRIAALTRLGRIPTGRSPE